MSSCWGLAQQGWVLPQIRGMSVYELSSLVFGGAVTTVNTATVSQVAV